ncbi:MAG: ABC transporter ATP-binding protein [Planctomycetaceae bacterium]
MKDTQVVNPFLRLYRYAYPHRRKLYLSVVLAWLVAFFWGVNLSMTFLVVKVFLQGQTVGQYIDEEISFAHDEIAKRTNTLKHLDGAPSEPNTVSDHDNQERPAVLKETSKIVEEAPDVLKDKARQQERLSKASRRLLILTWIKSHVVPYLPHDHFDLYALILAALLLATVLKGLCIFAQDVLIGSVVELTAISLRKHCFRRALSLDYQSVLLTGTPELMSRFTYDLSAMTNGLKLMGGKVVREPLKALTCIGIAMYFSWQLTLLSLLLAPIAAVTFYRLGRKLKQASRRLMESMSRIYKTLEETLSSTKIVIAFNGGRRHRQRFHRENKEYFAKAMKIVRIDSLTSPMTEFMGLFAASLALLPGAYLVLRDTREIWGITLASEPMRVEHLSSFYIALAGIIDPARKLSTIFSKMKNSSAAAERIFQFIDKQSLVTEPAEPKPMPRHCRSIEFHKVSFSYARHDGDRSRRVQVLDCVELEVRAGEVIVVVGENGSGKSTLVNFLPRFYDPDSGSVLVDGVDIRDVRTRDLRSHIGVVTQETLLFDESIADNIRYGKLTATEEEIANAARRAHVSQFVEQMQDGFNTLVGERGGRLSGGQRQRIALARAILRNPDILILDEATSAIDSTSERLIHETLRDFAVGRTTFIITHTVSQSILDFVTRIVVMEQGRMIAVGPHDDLIRTCPAYQRLFRAQMQQRGADRTAGNGAPQPGVFARSEAADETMSDEGHSSNPPEPHILRLHVAQSDAARDEIEQELAGPEGPHNVRGTGS